MSSLTQAYENEALSYLTEGTSMNSLFIGLSSEVGEVCSERMNILRGRTQGNREETLDELSDVLWYVTALAEAHHSSLEALMVRNIKKLKHREKYGKDK